MNFLALTPQASYALLACVALLIVLMYWLKPRAMRVKVASNLTWRTFARSRQPTADRWRWWLSLLLALATGLSIALALTRPQAPALGGIARRVVLVLDDSPSMLARGQDGTRRWDHAVERARNIVSSAGLGGQVMLLDTLGRTDTPEWFAPDTALAKLGRLVPGTAGIARMPLVPSGDHIEVCLVTDGVASLDVPAGVVVESVFMPADNVSITAFDAKPSLRDPTRYQALIQVFNASLRQQHVRLELTGADEFRLERDLDIPAGTTINQILDVTEYPAGVLRAQVRADSDGFDLDNVAYAVVAPHRERRVLLVTTGNRYLERSLGRLPGIALTVVKPSRYRASSFYDANVFDRFAPPEAPAQGTLLFRPPPVTWLPAVRRTTLDPVITRWNASHPLAANVPWQSVHIKRAALGKIATDNTQTDVVLAAGAGEAVLIAADGKASRWIEVGFALEDSNFAMQSAFPVFLGSALDWLTEAGATLAHGLGYVEIGLAGATVTGPDGKPVAAVSIPEGTLFDAARPGVFTAANDMSSVRVVANASDPQLSDINRSRFAGASGAIALSIRPARLNFEPWILLLVFAVALLALEWLAYARNRTV